MLERAHPTLGTSIISRGFSDAFSSTLAASPVAELSILASYFLSSLLSSQLAWLRWTCFSSALVNDRINGISLPEELSHSNAEALTIIGSGYYLG